MSPRQPIKSSHLDKGHMKHRGLLNKHFCKKNQISPMTWQKLSISTFPIISLWKLSCHSNQSSYPTGIKNITFVEGNILSKYAKFGFSVKINVYYPDGTVEISNFHFSHFTSMETISCHSNQSSYPTGIKNINFVERQCPMNVCQVSASSSLRFLRRIILNIFFQKFTVYVSLSSSSYPF